MTEKIVSVKNLQVSFDTFSGKVHAVRGVSFDLLRGETLAIVGESGSGKSVTCRSIIRLLSKNASIDEGTIFYEDEEMLLKTPKELRKIRGKEISIIFQDPMTSLNPTMQIGKQISRPMIHHLHLSKNEAKRRAIDLLDLVGIPNSEERYKNYPHQFSGGQRQRIVIAIALACNPRVLIADEPTTALDVTIQAQIIELMKEIQKKTGMSIIFITHDLGVVAKVADRVAVMYGGKIVEFGKTEEIYYLPQHPYTWGLLQSIPSLEETEEDLYAIPGSPPDLIHPPKGDAFYLRNPYALEVDLHFEPPLYQVSPTHYAATWLLDKRAPKIAVPASIQRRYDIYHQRHKEGYDE
ncbi:ABC transporter ATP-binding protein [Sporolactobacillus shoreicorticis]|uniref:ABC transporter ATP-binding protein n=1 Tax=Sporolactobacillus shoreicorticis TaxID=1923877 RepID=A0ABW5RZK8_9BACL|nr:ABC transporter ATP-binding protein [Sporolactobacillus shoreicorticis]MCO7125197.1 ABC transporter ATP-binding protein [Sporolactobacillus shoreicorticis]